MVVHDHNAPEEAGGGLRSEAESAVNANSYGNPTDTETATINDVETENENNINANNVSSGINANGRSSDGNERNINGSEMLRVNGDNDVNDSSGGIVARTSENVESSHGAVPGGLSPEALRSA